MRKSAFLKTTAIVVCFSFLMLTAPGVIAAEKNAPKFDFKRLIKKPAMFLSSLLPILGPIFDAGKNTSSNNKNDTGKKIKITGDLPSHRIADGD